MIDQIESSIVTQYADGPSRLEAALTGLTDSELNLALSADSWSLRQIVHHLADGDDIWKICIKAALGNNEGLFSLQWYWDRPQTEWADNWSYAHRSVGSSLGLLHANRQHIVELLEQIPNACEKSIRLKWPDGPEERITVRDVLEMQTRHVADHIHDIQLIRQAHHI